MYMYMYVGYEVFLKYLLLYCRNHSTYYNHPVNCNIIEQVNIPNTNTNTNTNTDTRLTIYFMDSILYMYG